MYLIGTSKRVNIFHGNTVTDAYLALFPRTQQLYLVVGEYCRHAHCKHDLACLMKHWQSVDACELTSEASPTAQLLSSDSGRNDLIKESFGLRG
jgi:hypothetical protein